MDSEVSQHLIQIYGMLRDLQIGHFRIQKMATASRMAMKSVPKVEAEYLKHWEAVSKELDGPQTETMRSIDQIIQRLQG